jgi:hypothetical protein
VTTWANDETGGSIFSSDETSASSILAQLAASSGASLVGYAPPGTGALTRTVQDALRAMVRSGDYSSTANFNTAQAALTESIGVAALRVGTGHDSAITMPTQTANEVFLFAAGGGTFNGTFDPTGYWGYDATANGGPSIAYSIEGHYNDGSTHWIEVYLQSQDAGGANNHRYDFQQINRTTRVRNSYFLGSQSFQFADGWSGDTITTYFLDAIDKRVALLGPVGSVGSLSGYAHVGIGVGDTWTSASDHYGVVLSPTLTSGLGAGRSFVGYKSAVNTSASALTLVNVYDYAANDGSLGAASAITNHYGFATGDFTIATGIQAAFLGGVSSGTNKFNLNMTGTAQNFLQGVTGIGIAASSTAALVLAAGTTGVASLRIPHGAAPTSPVNGDIWTTSAGGLFVRINGVTVGPLT